jgi:hypothetical protein
VASSTTSTTAQSAVGTRGHTSSGAISPGITVRQA